MNSSNIRIGKIACLALLGFASSCLCSAYGDDHSMLEDVHNELQQALSIEGAAPTDADRTSNLHKAIKTLRTMPSLHFRGAPKAQAVGLIKSALLEISNGDPNHQADHDIQEADRIVRNLEGSNR